MLKDKISNFKFKKKSKDFFRRKNYHSIHSWGWSK